MSDKKLMTADEFYLTIKENLTTAECMQSYAKYLFDNVVPKKPYSLSNEIRHIYMAQGYRMCIDQIKENLKDVI